MSEPKTATFVFAAVNGCGMQYATFWIDDDGKVIGRKKFTSWAWAVEFDRIPSDGVMASAAEFFSRNYGWFGPMPGVWFWGDMPDELYYARVPVSNHA